VTSSKNALRSTNDGSSRANGSLSPTPCIAAHAAATPASPPDA